MSRNPPLALAAVSLVLLFSAGRPVPAQADEARFATGLGRISGAISDGKWQQALDQLARLLAEHEGREYAQLRRADIVELDRRCRFRVSAPEIGPQDVISGKIVKCDLRSGSLEIHYTPKTLQDFERSPVFSYHPLRFVGPHAIEVRGRSYPRISRTVDGRVGAPAILVCNSADTGLGVSFGFEQANQGSVDRWLPASIYDYGLKKEVAAKEITLARSGKRYALRVKVDARRVTAYVNNKVLLAAPKPAGLFGGWGFANLEDFDEIRISGKAEPAWIQGRIDAALEEHRKRFLSTYAPEKVLPAWLFEDPQPAAGAARAAEATRAEPGPAKLLPGTEPTAGEMRCIDRALQYLVADEAGKCGKYLAGLEEIGALSELMIAYLRGMCAIREGDEFGAYTHLKRVCELDPAFVTGQQMLVSLALACGRESEVIETLAGLIERDPKNPAWQSSYVECLIRAGRFEEAQAAQIAAVRHGVNHAGMIQLGRTVARALRGPDWSKVYEHKSAHYHVCSDIDLATCKRAAQLLEDAYRAYNVHLKRARKPGRRFKVYLFSGQAGYQVYSEAVLGDKDATEAGCYSPWLRQLLIWNIPERDAMMRVVRHEGSHQYLHELVGHPPAWFDEGLAEYHETAEYVNGKWRIGEVRRDHLVNLEPEKKMLRIELFFALDGKRFYGEQAARNYAQAWAFIHFLRHGPRKYRPMFDQLLDGMANREPAGRVVRRVFAGQDLTALDTEFRAYVKSLVERGQSPGRTG